ncbi:MAG: hypothetical protein ACYC3Q_13235 [Gemmatimonadaceae bacterium]
MSSATVSLAQRDTSPVMVAQGKIVNAGSTTVRLTFGSCSISLEAFRDSARPGRRRAPLGRAGLVATADLLDGAGHRAAEPRGVAKPRAGSRVAVAYRPSAALAGDSVLALRAVFRAPRDCPRPRRRM